MGAHKRGGKDVFFYLIPAVHSTRQPSWFLPVCSCSVRLLRAVDGEWYRMLVTAVDIRLFKGRRLPSSSYY